MVRTLDAGGLERDVAKLALGLDPNRFTPYVAAFRSGGLRWSELERAGVPLIDLRVTSIKSPSILRSIMAFSRVVLREKIKIVHAYDASVVVAAPLARLLRVPVVLSAAVGSRYLLEEKFRNDVARTDQIVDSIVVNCRAMQRELTEKFGVSDKSIDLCYNGVETAQFFPAAEPRTGIVGDATMVIGSICVLRPEKRLEMLIDAFAQVSPLMPGLRLLIVGSGPELPKLQARAVERSVTDLCNFIPAVPDVQKYLRAMDIFVSCSSSEAFSNAILEAMACGCCPVGSRVGGTPELIADGERGLLFDPDSTDALAQKLALLIQHPELRVRFAQRAADFAATQLNMQVALNRMSEIYESRLQRKGAAH